MPPDLAAPSTGATGPSCNPSLLPPIWSLGIEREFTHHDFWLTEVNVIECYNPHPASCVGWISDQDKDKFYNIDLVISLPKNKGRAGEENQSLFYHSQGKKEK